MNYLHYDLNLDSEDIVEVTLDSQANVRLLTDANYDAYRQGKQHSYHGGLAKQSPIRIAAPHSGSWHLVVDLGGYAGSVRTSVNVIKGALQHA